MKVYKFLEIRQRETIGTGINKPMGPIEMLGFLRENNFIGRTGYEYELERYAKCEDKTKYCSISREMINPSEEERLAKIMKERGYQRSGSLTSLSYTYTFKSDRNACSLALGHIALFGMKRLVVKGA